MKVLSSTKKPYLIYRSGYLEVDVTGCNHRISYAEKLQRDFIEHERGWIERITKQKSNLKSVQTLEQMRRKKFEVDLSSSLQVRRIWAARKIKRHKMMRES